MNSSKGVAAAALAYICWGILPAYWKLLSHVPAYEILCHRMVWSLLLTAGLVIVLGRWRYLRAALDKRQELKLFTISSSLLAINWLLYIWAVNAGYIIEASLGYFINPLFNVLFGMLFFQERMRPLQWLALGFALAGVLYLTFYYGQFPWIALVLASSFAVYGLLHKKTTLSALDGLCLETAVLFAPAAGLLVWANFQAGGSFGHSGYDTDLLLAGAGLVTTIPLLLFGYAAHQIRLSTLGLLQYMAPSINLLLGVWIYHEDFSTHRLVGFCFIWAGLLLYLAESMARRVHSGRRRLHQAG